MERLRITITHLKGAERKAIADYKTAIRFAIEAGDKRSERKFREILGEEEHHLKELINL